MKKFKIKRNDKVRVITGKNKGQEGSVIKVLKEKDMLLVSGINVVKKHTKPNQMNPGGIVSKELPIHISNVTMICSKTGKSTKVGYKILEDGKKVRFAKETGEIIDN